MKGTGIRGILVIEKGSGLPLLFQRLDPRLTDIDPTLVAGFLTALESFSHEIVDQRASGFEVDYGKRLMTLVTGKYTIFAALSDKDSPEITEILHELQDEFEKKYYEGQEGVEHTMMSDQSRFDEFRELIVERVGLQNISECWVPEFTSKNVATWLVDDLRVLINGTNDISTILQNVDIESDKIIKVLTHLWTSGHIVFRNLLEMQDILIPTQDVYKYVKSNTPEHNELLDYSKELAMLLPEIISHLDGRTTVRDLSKAFSDKVYRLLDFLFEKGAVEVLSPEKKRILWSKEILDIAIQKAFKLYRKNQVISALRSSLQQIARPEIMSEIRIQDDSIQVNFDFQMYTGMTPKQVSELHLVWIDLMKRFVRNLPDNKRSNYVKALVNSIQDDYFSRFSEQEIEGLDEFSYFLEELLVIV